MKFGVISRISNYGHYIRNLLIFYITDVNLQIIGEDSEKYPYLKTILEKYMRLYQIKKLRFHIMKTGFNAHAISLITDRIDISTKLLDELSEGEAEAVIAHEFCHLNYRDSFGKLILSLIFFAPFVFFTIKLQSEPNSFTYSFFSVVFFVVFIYGIKIVNWITLQFEIQSDREAALRIENPDDLQNALFKMYIYDAKKNERISRRLKIVQMFLYLKGYFLGFTHPFLKERIEHIEFANKMRDKIQNLNR